MAILIPGYPLEKCLHMYLKRHVKEFSALFVRAKNWKQAQMPSIMKWIDKL